MRKIILSLLLFWFAGLGVLVFASQPLSEKRNSYRASDSIVKQQVEFKDPGSSGRNLNWDFRMLLPINAEYSLKYFIPDSTDFTRLCGMEHDTRYYYRQQKDSLHATGYENSTTFMLYSLPELRMRFPFEYGDTLFSFFEGEGQYSHRIPLKVKGYTRVEADAEGELLLPDRETVKKSLRVRTMRHYTETGKDSVEMTFDSYAWYAPGKRYPVFESVKTTIQKGTIDTTIFSTSFYYPPEIQTAQLPTEALSEDSTIVTPGAASVFTEAQLLPNPVVDILNINYKLTRKAVIWFTVHNNLGIPLCTTPSETLNKGLHNTKVRMNRLITGVYTLYVHVDDMIMKENVVKK